MPALQPSTAAPKPKLSFLFMALLASGAVALSVVLTTRGGVLPGLAQPRQHADSARFVARASDPVRFLGGLSSYQDLASVRETLRTAGFNASLTQQSLPADPRYPPRDDAVLSVADYAFCGTRGPLTLDFFNDRLYEASFVPRDAQRCRTGLLLLYPELRRDTNGRAELDRAPLRLATNLDLALSEVGRTLKTEPYVIWQDQRLIRQHDEWDERFATLTRTP